MTMNMEEVTKNNKFNIVDIILLDHKYLKECIKVIKNDDGDKKIKLKKSKNFIDAIHKHAEAEKKSVYAPLIKVQALRREIIKSEIEHGIIDHRVKVLAAKLTGLRVLNEELEMEMKVLAELLEHHLKEEEAVTLPSMKKNLDKTILNEMGFQFMKLRNFSEKDLQQYPKLQQEVTGLKKLGHKVSGNFISKVQKHILLPRQVRM